MSDHNSLNQPSATSVSSRQRSALYPASSKAVRVSPSVSKKLVEASRAQGAGYTTSPSRSTRSYVAKRPLGARIRRTSCLRPVRSAMFIATCCRNTASKDVVERHMHRLTNLEPDVIGQRAVCCEISGRVDEAGAEVYAFADEATYQVAEVRSCARGNLLCSPAPSLAWCGPAAVEQLQLHRS